MRRWKAEDPLGVIHRVAMDRCVAVIFRPCDFDGDLDGYRASQYELVSAHADLESARDVLLHVETLVDVEEDLQTPDLRFLDLLALVEHHARACGSKHRDTLRRELVAHQKVAAALRIGLGI